MERGAVALPEDDVWLEFWKSSRYKYLVPLPQQCQAVNRATVKEQ